MLWIYEHYKYFTLSVRGSIPALKVLAEHIPRTTQFISETSDLN